MDQPLARVQPLSGFECPDGAGGLVFEQLLMTNDEEGASIERCFSRCATDSLESCFIEYATVFDKSDNRIVEDDIRLLRRERRESGRS
jgi:hypothetical protein